MFIAGLIAGQFGLFVVWAVLGPQRPLARFVSALLAVVSFSFLFFLGTGAIATGRELRELFRFLLALPLLFLAAQLPLWILKMALGCRIVFRQTEDSVDCSPSRQFGLQHMLGATTVVAIALGLARVAMTDLGPPGGRTVAEMWFPLMMACLMVGLWSAFSTLPCLWAVWMVRETVVSLGAVAIYTVVMTTVVLAVINAITDRSAPGEVVVGMMCFHGALMLVLLGGLFAVRACGAGLSGFPKTARRQEEDPPS